MITETNLSNIFWRINVDELLQNGVLVKNIIFKSQNYNLEAQIQAESIVFGLRCLKILKKPSNIILSISEGFDNSRQIIGVFRSLNQILYANGGFCYEKESSLLFSITIAEFPLSNIGPLTKAYDVDTIIRIILKNANAKTISKDKQSWLCSAVYSVFEKESVILRLKAPITVVGDLHGNFYDLLRIFSVFGFPDRNNYLFLGDYVDRGENSVDIICLLFALKI